MKAYTLLAVVFGLMFTQCVNKDKRPAVNAEAPVSTEDSFARVGIQSFGVPYPTNMKFDSGCLAFYCNRTFDTSSLILLQATGKEVRGVYYETLPEYHQSMFQYAPGEDQSKLMFFEGYSFVIDTATWRSVIMEVGLVLDAKNYERVRGYTDGSSYALYFGGRSIFGGTPNEAVFERLDRFMKDRFLFRFKRARKPRMFKIKS